MNSNFVLNYLQDYTNNGHSSLDFMTGNNKNGDEVLKRENDFTETQEMHFPSNQSEKAPSPEPGTNSDSDIDDISNPTLSKTEPLEKYPFCKDMHGVPSDNIKMMISGDESAGKAMELVKNGTNIPLNFECPYCNIIIAHPKRFLIHYKWHSFGLTNAKRLEIMQLLEQSKKDRRKARLAERLSQMEAKDDSEANFPCKDCEKIFIKKSSLTRHRMRFHPQRTPITECKICFHPVKGQTELRAHLKVHMTKDVNTNPKQKYQCPECPKRYKFNHSLVKHMDTHLEKTHPCPKCPKMFGSQKHLSRHIKTHDKISKGANYHCAYCGKSYYDSFCLKVHERNHTQEKPFSCEICNSRFVTNSSLQRHLKVSHSSSKPYPCECCGKSFSFENTRDSHILREHADPSLRPHACKYCDGRYLKPRDLRNHIYKHHPEAKKPEGD